MSADTPTPSTIRLHRKSRVFEVGWEDGTTFNLPCEYLRVFSPSAEVQGHGPGQAVLLIGKEKVNISAIEPVGHYAVKLIFDDKHDSGLFSWSYLHWLGANYEENWSTYLGKLEEVGYRRKEVGPG
ncbi:MAG: gamma-butyrobetaine hydroxylase-like domain-containing protein [Gammaproteobacteria bacterium]